MGVNNFYGGFKRIFLNCHKEKFNYYGHLETEKTSRKPWKDLNLERFLAMYLRKSAIGVVHGIRGTTVHPDMINRACFAHLQLKIIGKIAVLPGSVPALRSIYFWAGIPASKLLEL